MTTIYPKVDIQKKQDWSIHPDNLIIEFPVTNISNLTLKWYEIIQRVDNLNLLIEELFKCYSLFNQEVFADPITDSIFKTPLLYKQKFITEQIFYWLRKTVDEMISLIYVLDYLKKYDKFPEIIKIDCIGKLINSNDFISIIKNDNLDLLTIINDISNTYKHSFLNSETHSHIGEKDPLVFSYGFKNNNLKKEMVWTQYKVEDIINSLNKLIDDFIKHIKKQ